MSVVDATREFEDQLFSQGVGLILGVDEVGRGAIAGPCAVGVATLIPSLAEHPVGLRDSKMLSEKKRLALVPLLQQWTPASAVGMATAYEVDTLGITAALCLAGQRALTVVISQLHEKNIDTTNGLILLDGKHNWFGSQAPMRVLMKEKADRDCISVAAASVLAKVERDNLMIELSNKHPEYGWQSNKGYGATTQYQAINEHGLVPDIHRATWIKLERDQIVH